MKIMSSYKVRLVGINKIVEPTIRIYREALAFLIDVYDKEWDSLSRFTGVHERFRFAEMLVHSTKNNISKYDFDVKFLKMPTYLRRATIQAALGTVSSYHSNHKNWEDNKQQGDEPKLQPKTNSLPTFYKENMYLECEEPNMALLKLFHNNDWVWVKVKLRPTDVKYINKYWTHCKASAPTLEKRYGKYYLRFAFEEKIILSDTDIANQRICSVDLGLNADAVCSIMTSDGTILARKFINFPSDKDHLNHVLGRIKRQQREHGSESVTSLWGYARRCNDELAKHIAAAITDFAVLYSVDCVVFEHLDFKGKRGKGSKRQKLSLWRKNGIQDYVSHKAHRCGIRISHICAWGTSRLAYNGSGVLKRDENNHALATFTDGKQYNCDLSASYNIGSRYFIRELLKPLPVTARSQLSAEVPEIERRTSCTLDTLWRLNTVMNEI